jgi:hypothetical protein
VVSVANGRECGTGLDPEDRIGVVQPVGFDADMVCPNAGIIARVEPEMPSNLAQIVILGRANPAVGERDMEQAAEEILEYGAIAIEQTPDLSGVAVEPGGALAGQIEDEPNMLFFAGGNLEHFAKGGNFIAGDGTIGLCHLGAERNHRNREGDLLPRVVILALAIAPRGPTRDMTRRAFEQRAERPAKGQLTSTGKNTADKAHLLRGIWCEPVKRLAKRIGSVGG